MEQSNIFGLLYPNYKIKNHIRLIELFAGVGSQAMALRDLGVEFEHYRVVEFDKYAIKSYNAIHDTNFETSDIRDVRGIDLKVTEKNKYTYLLTYSFPCQDLSKAGKQKGMDKGGSTRSGLLWEIERILDECDELPQVLLMENVPDVIGTKNIKNFQKWRLKLEQLGYSNFVERLNAKNYGIPQNRNRCFMVSILGDYNYEFPKKIPLELRLKDMLEDEVDEKYYLSDEQVEKFQKSTYNTSASRLQEKDYVDTLCARDYKDPKCVKVPEATKKGYSEAYDGDYINLAYPDSKTRRGRVGKQVANTLLCNDNNGVVVADGVYTGDSKEFHSNPIEGLSRTLKANKHDVGVAENNCRIRKLIPLECWRLMGFTDEDFWKAAELNSNSQLYKQAGNSIVKQVLMAIFKGLF